MTARSTLYLTYYSEYLMQGELCVGVRDRRSGTWLPLHAASRAYALGPQRFLHSSPLVAEGARVGERLCLRTPARRIVTGPIISVETPSQRLIDEAEHHWQAVCTRVDPMRTLAESRLLPTRRDNDESE